jgi:tetratricopeptide (TPR) repeat protein
MKERHVALTVRPRTVRHAAVVAAAILAAACAGGAPPGEVAPADLAALEAQRAQTPNDPTLNLQLARGYYAAGRYADARGALAVVLTAQPGNSQAEAWLGLTYEGLEQYDSARATYTTVLARKPGGSVERLLRGRLQLLARKELLAAARQSIARESLLTATPPEPNTIAVMPFRYTGSDSTLRPLERGLAALVVTDLSKVGQLRLVERDRMQALLDELQLAADTRVDPATGARSGRLVRAGQVVQGQFADVPTANFRVDASVVRTTDAQVAATGSDADALRALFDIEKRVVFQLLDRMGIVLTPAERTAVSERPTQDLQAFLLYSRGLESQDRGDFSAAAQSFQAAAQRDPSFAAAAQQAATSADAAAAAAAPAGEIAGALPAPGGGTVPPGASLLGGVNSTVPSGTSTIDAVPTTSSIEIASGGGDGGTGPTIGVPPTQPNPVCEAANCQGPQNVILIGNIIIIVRRP